MPPSPGPLPYKTLYEIPGFEKIRYVSESLGIELMIHGGFVRRLVVAFRQSQESMQHPEDLAFFSSDIDVVHSGNAGRTAAVSDALVEAVPFGECIRWQIKSAEEFAVFESALPFNGIVPANLMSITTSQNWGIKDEWQGQLDIHKRRYRYIRNGFYKKSPLFMAGKDLEIFSALLYFKVLVDDAIFSRELTEQPGINEAKTVVHSACSSPAMLIALQESAYLRARLLYLMKDIRVRVLSRFEWSKQVQEFGINRLVEYLLTDDMFDLGSQVAELVTETQTVTISARLGGDQYRFEDETESWHSGDDARKQFEATLARYSSSINDQEMLQLGSGQRVAYSSPNMTINQGRSSSSRTGKTVQEFFHFAVPLRAPDHRDRPPNNEFAVLLELSSSSDGKEDGKPLLLSVPSVCSFVQRDGDAMLYVRVNAFGFLEDSRSLTGTSYEDSVSAKVFVLAPAPDKTEQPDAPKMTCDEGSAEEEAQPSASTNQATIIFIHGILSQCSTCFANMYPSFEQDAHFSSHSLETFDYDYEDEMSTSAVDLVEFIQATTSPHARVILVCHSMGGLVGRLSVLSGKVPQVKRLIMMGTPNFGALRTAQLGLLAQLAMRLAGKVYALFRKPGIRDLTRVTEIFGEAIASGSEFADAVEYVTIPGEFFNESRTFWDRGKRTDGKLSVAGFATLNFVSELLKSAPLWGIGLKRPHDGIVESQSNSLIPCASGRISEKCATINDPGRFGRTYVHLTHERCSDLTHVMIQQDSAIVDLVKDLCLADSITNWHDGLDRDDARHLKVVFE